MHRLHYKKLKALGLPQTPSQVAVAMTRLLTYQDHSIADLCRVVQSDPEIARYILKFVNGTSLNQRRSIVYLPMALMCLDTFQMRDLVLGLSIFQTYKNARSDYLDVNLFWSRSLATAMINHELATCAKTDEVESFTVGLLGGIGEFLMSALYSSEYAALLTHAKAINLSLLENDRFGFDRHELTEHFLNEWGLSKGIVYAVCNQENPDIVDFSLGLHCQHLALSLKFSRRLAQTFFMDNDECRLLQPDVVKFAACLGISSEQLIRLLERANERWHEWGHLLEIQTHYLPPFDGLLRGVSS